MGDRPYAALVVGRSIVDLDINTVGKVLFGEDSVFDANEWAELDSRSHVCILSINKWTGETKKWLRLARPYWDAELDEWYYGFVIAETKAWRGLEIDLDALLSDVNEGKEAFKRMFGVDAKVILLPEYH